MLPYSRGLIMENSNNYGIVKTETVFGFGPPNTNSNKYVNDSFNTKEPLEWILSQGNFPRSMPEQIAEEETSRALKTNMITKKIPTSQERKNSKKNKKKLKRKSKGVKKCIFKVLRKGGNDNEGGNTRKKTRGAMKMKMQRKYMMPLILGLLAAKSILIPIALKALAFLSAKGLMMGFFSTVMASVLSLKGMFDHSHGSQNRKDDTKTQVEIIQVPTKSEDHVYYDEHYKRGDLMPMAMPYRHNNVIQ